VVRPLSLSLLAVAIACAWSSAQAATPRDGPPLASQLVITHVPPPTPTPSPVFAPGPRSIVGTISRVGGHELTLATVEEGSVRVDLTNVRDIWRETSVDTSALEIGDDLFVNGYRAPSGFVAFYVDANIGRIDGVIRSIDGDTLEVTPLRPGAPTWRLVMSRYLRSDSLALADVGVGDTIGAVVYRPRSGIRRITKMWR